MIVKILAVSVFFLSVIISIYVSLNSGFEWKLLGRNLFGLLIFFGVCKRILAAEILLFVYVLINLIGSIYGFLLLSDLNLAGWFSIVSFFFLILFYLSCSLYLLFHLCVGRQKEKFPSMEKAKRSVREK